MDAEAVDASRTALAARLAGVTERIGDAARAVGRSPEELTLIVVTKFHPATLVADLAALGVRDVGENRHQEAQDKAAELADLDLRWHFIGQLQTKKARQAARYAHAIHSIDRERLVDALSGIERTVDAFLQVNLTDDPGRGGAAPDELDRLAERVLETPSLRLRGVMAVAPLPEEEEAARAFERLRGYSERVQALAPDATAISAGMTHDFAEAIAAGATHLRIGSAITGNRPAAG
ncbi:MULTISPECIES: YggS family pyridoxal phosphate-dependent enzyme [unclassified Leucobacter]|uniref:YggS family pyridoxal phosphate-dependent enzyme n=1 Tax=unclassified Leucobacter TaxID=2621730 RepID=UPI0006217391|nr:YggS family pyridoxal phosphate-dependent enzyme [Leucobacter sp. Ag1]KKI20165.1 alanine racemase [Leucobacter sp. Ag1]